MKKYIVLIFILSIASLNAQISPGQIKELSNEQLDLIRSELSTAKTNNSIKNTSSPKSNKVTISASSNSAKSEYFGYTYFTNRDINFYNNIPTPVNYKLGSGDEIVISLWGETNFQKKLTLNKYGQIYFENIGFLSLANMTINEATNYLVEKLSVIYSTLKDDKNSTKLMVELSTVKSINVYFTGEVKKPGISLIHPFSDIFVAIIQGGGLTRNGSLRNVQLIRNNEVIEEVDFYHFFIDGDNDFSDIKMLDGDIIYVPTVKKRIHLVGQVANEGFFELKKEENFSDLIKFSGGLKPSAAQNLIYDQIIPLNDRTSDDFAIKSETSTIDNAIKLKLNNGDKITIKTIKDVQTTAEVFGRVKNPGQYPANTLGELLVLAGGFDDPIFRKSIVDEMIILRKDEDNFDAEEIKLNYDDSKDFQLIPGDKILVYGNANYSNNFTYSIGGQVNKPGTYSYYEGLTLDDAIKNAGGITRLGTSSGIIVTQEFSSTNDVGLTTKEQKLVRNITGDFKILPDYKIKILTKENVVSIKGNVYNPGVLSYTKSSSVKSIISESGGYKPHSLKKEVYVRRANGKIITVGLFKGRFVKTEPGDTIVVPRNPDPQDFDITRFISDLSSTLANIAAILIVADNN